MPARWVRARALSLMARGSAERARRWRGVTVWGWMFRLMAWAGVSFLLFRLAVVFLPIYPGWLNPDARWYRTVAELLTPLALAGAAYLLFLLWRMKKFRRPFRRKATRRPDELVQTSGTILGEVVGRDDLCRTIMEDLRDPSTRRPHVIVGGVGAGKTATLVRLTALLAHKHAVPVPVRLRDCDKALDFRKAARARFNEHAELARLSQADADKIWHQLCRDNKIVVLADGLEEALQGLGGSIHESERDNLIRLAIHRAWAEQLPVVIASRPYEPLRGMDASITELEPLCERDTLQYLRRRGPGEEDPRLQWIVETAEGLAIPALPADHGRAERQRAAPSPSAEARS